MSTHSLQGLRPVRDLLQIRAQTVADRLGCTITTYYRYEGGKRRIYFDQALSIAQLLRVDVGMLAREPTLEERVELMRRDDEHRAVQALSPEALPTYNPAALEAAHHAPAAPADLDAEPDLAQVLADWGDAQE